MDKEKIRVELDAFIESGKAKVEVNSGNFVTTHIDMLRIAEHFYEQAEKGFMEKAEKWWYEHLVGFLKEGLTEGVIGEFTQFMTEQSKKN